MRIDNYIPYNDFSFSPAAAEKFPAAEKKALSEPVNYYGAGVVVEISAEGRAAAAKFSAAQDGVKGVGGIEGPKECQTCKNRKYVDDSSDPSVSYQSPTHISPGQSAGAVMAHEREHVTNEQARADREDRKVISQTVSVTTSVCPECGKVYVSGGVTRTVTKSDNSEKMTDNASVPQNASEPQNV